MKHLGAAFFSMAILSSCASGGSGASSPVPESEPHLSPVTVTGPVTIALRTVGQLVEAGNEQKAIDRLTQLLGRPDLTDQERGEALYQRALLRRGAGNDVEGALQDFDLLLTQLPDTDAAARIGYSATETRREADALRHELEHGSLTPTEEFEILFRLGRHQEAADLMFVRNLSPEEPYILDMYQIGFLCAEPGLSGPVYETTTPDGVPLEVNFCDFGK